MDLEEAQRISRSAIKQVTKGATGFPATTRKRSFCGWYRLSALTSHKSPANAPIFNRSTSRTNLLKPLETATVRIHKLPHTQLQPLRLNQSNPKNVDKQQVHTRKHVN
ncbi:hypothetical protein YC2023_078549 [Brassica napus]